MAGIPTLSGGPSFRNPADVPVVENASDRYQLSREQFFKIMITELTTQDPLNPMDNQQFLGQLAQLESLNSQSKMTNGIDSLVNTLQFSRLNNAASLLGKVVKGSTHEQAFDADGNPRVDIDGKPIYQDVPVQGLANSVTMDGGEVSVVLMVPVTDDAGNFVLDSSGNIITRKVVVKGDSINELTDPMIVPSPVGG